MLKGDVVIDVSERSSDLSDRKAFIFTTPASPTCAAELEMFQIDERRQLGNSFVRYFDPMRFRR